MTNPHEKRRPWVIAVLWAAKFGVCSSLGAAAYAKLSGAESAVTLFDELGMGAGGRYVIGVLEALTVVMILLPQSAVHGAVLGLGIMVGAVIAHLTVIGLAGLPWALLTALGCLVVIYIRRADAEFLDHLIDH